VLSPCPTPPSFSSKKRTPEGRWTPMTDTGERLGSAESGSCSPPLGRRAASATAAPAYFSNPLHDTAPAEEASRGPGYDDDEDTTAVMQASTGRGWRGGGGGMDHRDGVGVGDDDDDYESHGTPPLFSPDTLRVVYTASKELRSAAAALAEAKAELYSATAGSPPASSSSGTGTGEGNHQHHDFYHRRDDPTTPLPLSLFGGSGGSAHLTPTSTAASTGGTGGEGTKLGDAPEALGGAGKTEQAPPGSKVAAAMGGGGGSGPRGEGGDSDTSWRIETSTTGAMMGLETMETTEAGSVAAGTAAAAAELVSGSGRNGGMLS